MAFPPTYPKGIQVLPGYPMPDGAKYLLVFDRVGPTSYTQYVASTGLSGDILKASALGMGGFDNADDTIDDTGQIACYVVMTLAGSGNAVPQVTLVYYSLVTATLGGVSQTLGTQIGAATNLSGFSFRLQAYMV